MTSCSAGFNTNIIPSQNEISVSSPPFWWDTFGVTCPDYESEEYCTLDGKEGIGWRRNQWGSIDQIQGYGKNYNINPLQACAQCGGGVKMTEYKDFSCDCPEGGYNFNNTCQCYNNKILTNVGEKKIAKNCKSSTTYKGAGILNFIDCKKTKEYGICTGSGKGPNWDWWSKPDVNHVYYPSMTSAEAEQNLKAADECCECGGGDKQEFEISVPVYSCQCPPEYSQDDGMGGCKCIDSNKEFVNGECICFNPDTYLNIDTGECECIDPQNCQCQTGSFLKGNKCVPIICPTGTILEGNDCIPLECPSGTRIPENKCVPIICPTGTGLEGNVCNPILCPTGTRLQGNDCNPIVCPTGTRLEGNNCNPIVCPTGTRLEGNNCNPIICPTGTTLEGNDCIPLVCPSGTRMPENKCVSIVCPTGTTLEGNNCNPIVCPTGTRLEGNNCKPIICPCGTRLEGNNCKPIICPCGTRLEGNNCNPNNNTDFPKRNNLFKIIVGTSTILLFLLFLKKILKWKKL